jgi:6-phosphogluconolactonase
MKQTKNIQWKHFASIESLRHEVCTAITQQAAAAISQRGKFSIVLAGGNTPRAIYQLLSEVKADWAHWHIYHGDERCLPPDHADRNSLMAEQAWLHAVAIPAHQVHHIPAELGPVEGAKAYAATLENAGTFDLVLLGLGEDGHTASLFPNQAVDNSAAAVAVFNSPKPPLERVTMSQQRLSDTHQVLFLVTGAGKQEAADNWRNGVAIPASLVTAKDSIDIYCYEVNLAA